MSNQQITVLTKNVTTPLCRAISTAPWNWSSRTFNVISRSVIPLVPQSKLKLTLWYWWWFSSSKPCQIWCKICSIGPKSGETHDFWPRWVPNVYVTTTDGFWYIMNDFWSTEFDVYARRPLRCRLWCSLTISAQMVLYWNCSKGSTVTTIELSWPLNSHQSRYRIC